MRLKGLFSFKAKVIEPCSKFLSVFKFKFDKTTMRAPTFRMPKRRSKPRGIRTRTVRFRKPFSLKALRFPQCRPKTKFRFRKRRPAVSSKFKSALQSKRRIKAATKPVPKVRIAELLTVLFHLRKPPKEVDTDSSEQVNMADVTSVSVSEGGHGKEPFPSPITPGYVMRISTNSKKDTSSDDLEDVEDACRSFENYLVEMIVEEGKLKDLTDVEELLYCWRNLKSPVFIDLVCRFYGEVCKDVFAPSEEDESRETPTSEL